MNDQREDADLPDRHQRTLLELSRLDALYEGDLEEALPAMTEAAARALDVDRVSVWTFVDDGRAIRCVHGFDRRDDTAQGGDRLSAEEYPEYFGALRNARQIVADDIRRDPRTAGLTEEYSAPLDIASLLDAPVRAEGELWGVVCHEDRGEPREWTTAAQSFAASVADFVGRAVEAHERREIERALRERKTFLNELVRSSPGIIFRLDAGDLAPTYASPNFEEVTGYPREAFLDDPGFWMEEMHPDDRSEVVASIRAGLEGETQRIVEEYRFRHADGDYHWYHTQASVERKDGAPVSVVGHALDITGRKRAEESLRASEARFRALFEQNVAGAYQSTPDGELLRVNQAFADIFGYDDPEEMTAASAWDLYPSPGDREELLERLRSTGHAENFEFRSEVRDGSPVWLLENAVLIEDPEHDRPTIVGTLIDISDRKRLEQELEHMAFHDPLTDAANRRLLQDRAQQAMAMAGRQGERLAVLYLDLVDFKRVNDTLGHDAGDRVLVETARRLEERTREADTVARVGGDEFAVLLTHIDSAESARAVGQELAERLGRPLDVQGRSVEVTARIGVALFPEHGESFEDLLVAADRAMYQSEAARADDESVSLYAGAEA